MKQTKVSKLKELLELKANMLDSLKCYKKTFNYFQLSAYNEELQRLTSLIQSLCETPLGLAYTTYNQKTIEIESKMNFDY